MSVFYPHHSLCPRHLWLPTGYDELDHVIADVCLNCLWVRQVSHGPQEKD